MRVHSIFYRLTAKLRKFASASGGNMVTIFAITLVPVMGAIGAAVDYGQANSLKTAMQAAADTASLGTIKSASSLTPAQVQSTAAGLFNGSFAQPGIGPAVTASYDAPSNTVTVSASATFKPNIMSMVGITKMMIST